MSDTEHFHAVAGERITITEPRNLHSPTRAGADEGSRSVLDQVLDEVATLSGLDRAAIGVDAPLLSFGFDSLDLLQLAMNLEEQLGIDIPDEACDRAELGTVRGLATYVDGRLAMRNAPTGQPWKVPIVKHCGGIHRGIVGSVVSENGEDQPSSGQGMTVGVSVTRPSG